MAKSLAPGSTRVNHKGGVETLREIPIALVDDMPGNKIYGDAVQKYSTGHDVPPEIRVKGDGRYEIYDGHHRVAADRKRGVKTILAWVSRSGPDGFPEVPH